MICIGNKFNAGQLTDCFSLWKYYICRLEEFNDIVLFKKYSDSIIVEGIRNQDDTILNWLYDHYLADVRKHVLQNNGSPDDVSDVFQDSIIVLYSQIRENNLNLTTDLKGYFFGIARNVWNAQLRKLQKTVSLEIDVPEEHDLDGIDDPLLQRVVSRAFQKLKPDQQEVLNLFYDDHSYEVIAEKMGLKNEAYARRKKYLCKELLMELVSEDPEYQEYLRFRK